jgi:hypothetical protein
MNALQIIPPKPAPRVPRSALLFRVSVAILLLALVRGVSMSRGEEGIDSKPDALVEMKYTRDQVVDNDESLSSQPAAASDAATTDGSGSGGGEQAGSASAQPNAQPAMPTAAGIKNDPQSGSEAGKPAAAEAKSDTPSSAAINDRNRRDRNSSRALAKPPVRRAYQSRGKRDDRSWKLADAPPVWLGPPPIIYGPTAEAITPCAISPAGAAASQDRLSSSPVTGMWRRVVEAPGAVLNGGKQALYGVLDSIW